MISTPTVLILGAGASMPFGFPSGRSLLIEICSGLRIPESDLSQQLLNCGYDSQSMREFCTALNSSMQPSVDAFLENRPEFLLVGKAAIACSLIPRENETSFERKPDGQQWYEYLFNKMAARLDDFNRNTLSIVTYNYDRSLEHFFFEALKHSYGLGDEECSDHLRALPIVHLHGKLGDYPWSLPRVDLNGIFVRGKSRSYENTVTPEIVDQCVAGIRIIHEDLAADPQFAKAQVLLQNSEEVYFLGFGYHPTNVQRLGVNNVAGDKRIAGTAYQVLTAERVPIQERFDNRISLAPPNIDILNFFRELHYLR